MAGTEFYGIGAAQNVDNSGELLYIEGLDNSRLTKVKDEHDKDNFFHTLGSVKFSKKIMSEKDCENSYQKRCWSYVKVPFLYCEGVLADDHDHPNAKAAASILKFSQRQDVPLNVGLSIDGAVLERKDASGKVTEDKETGKNLTKTVGLAVSFTTKPCNPKCKLFLKNDLTKSIADAPVPKVVLDAINREQSRSSFTEQLKPVWDLYSKMQKLKKSLDDYFTGFAGVKCHDCGNAVRFFKSSKDIPNFCRNCGSSFSLSELWKAINN